MKLIEISEQKHRSDCRVAENQSFSFRCHQGLACFNQCCRNLNLFLYPYDIIRLKQHLQISSDLFLERFVDIVMRPGNFFPSVLLRMTENGEHTCPFLTDEGCSVYLNRPDSCRTFPIEQGLIQTDTKQKEIIHFFRPPDFCLGQYEDQQHTPKEWAIDQDAVAYNKMTAKWAELKALFQQNPWGSEGPDGRKGKMAFMSTYNVDKFRDFIFNSSFLKRYKVKQQVLKQIKRDDVRLLQFSFSWVRFFLFNHPSKHIRLR